MVRPKKHFFIVEVTDMEKVYTEKQVRNIIDKALDYGLYHNDRGRDFQNLQVKSMKRVLSGIGLVESNYQGHLIRRWMR